MVTALPVESTSESAPEPTRGASSSGSVAASYGRDDEPLAGYLTLVGTYLIGLAGLGAIARWRKVAWPEQISVADLALVAIATHKASRTIAKDAVLSPVRAPFTRFKGAAGPGEVNEEVRGRGLRKAVGELLTCPFCLDHWVATAFVAGLVAAPRPTRLLASILTARSGADFLQFAYAAAEKHAAHTPTEG